MTQLVDGVLGDAQDVGVDDEGMVAASIRRPSMLSDRQVRQLTGLSAAQFGALVIEIGPAWEAERDAMDGSTCPQAVDGHGVEAALEVVGAGACVEDHSRDERVAYGGPKLAERPEVVPGDTGSGLDLEGEDGAVVSLEDEVDLVGVVGSPVASTDKPVHPGRLLEQLADDEGLHHKPDIPSRFNPTLRAIQARYFEPCPPGISRSTAPDGSRIGDTSTPSRRSPATRGAVVGDQHVSRQHP